MAESKDNIVRVLLVEHHALMRRAIKGQFALEPSSSVVGEAVAKVHQMLLFSQPI